MTRARDLADLISSGSIETGEITSLDAAKLTGTVNNARISLDAAEIPNISTDKLTSGTLPDARIAAMASSKLTGALPAISGASLTSLTAGNISSGTIPTSRLGSGTASSSTFLRGDSSYAAAGFDVASITGATALAVEPDKADEIVLSDAGTLKRLDIQHMFSTPSFLAQLSTATDMANTGYTKIPFDQVVYATSGTYDSSTNYRWTPGIAGKYLISARTRYSSAAESEQHQIDIRLNGDTGYGIVSSGKASTWGDRGVTGIMALDDDDYIEVWMYQDSGGTVSCGDFDPQCYFSGHKISGGGNDA